MRAVAVAAQGLARDGAPDREIGLEAQGLRGVVTGKSVTAGGIYDVRGRFFYTRATMRF